MLTNKQIADFQNIIVIEAELSLYSSPDQPQQHTANRSRTVVKFSRKWYLCEQRTTFVASRV